jgi:hypothetical protein
LHSSGNSGSSSSESDNENGHCDDSSSSSDVEDHDVSNDTNGTNSKMRTLTSTTSDISHENIKIKEYFFDDDLSDSESTMSHTSIAAAKQIQDVFTKEVNNFLFLYPTVSNKVIYVILLKIIIVLTEWIEQNFIKSKRYKKPGR